MTAHRVRVINLQGRFPVEFELVRGAALAALRAHRTPPVKINVVVMDNAQIRGPNRRYLQHDRETDVLAFRYPSGETRGEVLVSVEQAEIEARERKIPAEEELLRYVVHGVLHFLGYDDQSPRERQEMHREQERILKDFIRGIRS
jgi:probable rRNA maturation factor